jgi:hypothetical protein
VFYQGGGAEFIGGRRFSNDGGSAARKKLLTRALPAIEELLLRICSLPPDSKAQAGAKGIHSPTTDRLELGYG